MNNKINIAVDAGKYATKTAIKINERVKRASFRTKVQEVDNLGIDIPPNTFKVEFNNKTYLVGESINENKIKYDISKKSIEHLICIYLSVAKIAKKYGTSNVHLAVGTPLNIYKNNHLKEEYMKYILGNRQFKLKVNDKPISFNIVSILMLPEGLGPIYFDIDNYRKGKVSIVDIGGLNINYCTYRNLVPQYQEMFITNNGVNIFRSQLCEALSAEFGIYISDSDVDQILEDGYIIINGKIEYKSRDIIQRLKVKYIQYIVNHAKSRGLTLFESNGKVVFSGGGSQKFKNIINKLYPSAIIPTNSQFANVYSFLKILEAKSE